MLKLISYPHIHIRTTQGVTRFEFISICSGQIFQLQLDQKRAVFGTCTCQQARVGVCYPPILQHITSALKWAITQQNRTTGTETARKWTVFHTFATLCSLFLGWIGDPSFLCESVSSLCNSGSQKIFYPRIRRPVFDPFQLIGKRGIFPPYFTPFCLGLENQPILGLDWWSSLLCESVPSLCNSS